MSAEADTKLLHVKLPKRVIDKHTGEIATGSILRTVRDGSGSKVPT